MVIKIIMAMTEIIVIEKEIGIGTKTKKGIYTIEVVKKKEKRKNKKLIE